MMLLWLSLLLAAQSDVPAFSARDVSSAANHAAGAVVPGQVLVVHAANAGPEKLAESHLDAEGKMATIAGETRVLFDGIAAPIVYAVRGEIGAMVPYGLAGKSTTGIVVEYQGRRSEAVRVPVLAASPALYTLDASGKGQAAMLNETGCCNSSRNPAAPGTIAQLFATGAGQTNPGGIDGLYSDYSKLADYPKPELPVSVTVGGIPAEILYAGEASLHVSGTFVVNFRIPKNAPEGDAVPLALTIGDQRSAEGVTMAIRAAVQRVLIVERDAGGRERLARAFRESGYEVIAREAVASEGGAPDVLICELDGNASAIQAARGENPRLRAIAIVSELSEANLRDADVAGAQAVFLKSAAPEKIVERALELLNARAFP